MIHRHGFRLSNDSDIFTDELDVERLAKADVELLTSNGLHVEVSKRYPGFVEAIVSSEEEQNLGHTKLQWVTEGLRGFFTPIPDEEVGFRLHFADLSVNKLLACAGRKQARDFVDLWMIDRLAIPLWRLAVAAPGKDIKWSPLSILDGLSRNMCFSEDDFDNDVVSMMDLDPPLIMRELMASIEEARRRIPGVSSLRYGSLEVIDGETVTLREVVDSGSKWIMPLKGGAMRTPEGGDAWLTRRLVDTFGLEGSAITDSLTFP